MSKIIPFPGSEDDLSTLTAQLYQLEPMQLYSAEQLVQRGISSKIIETTFALRSLTAPPQYYGAAVVSQAYALHPQLDNNLNKPIPLESLLSIDNLGAIKLNDTLVTERFSYMEQCGVMVQDGALPTRSFNTFLNDLLYATIGKPIEYKRKVEPVTLQKPELRKQPVKPEFAGTNEEPTQPSQKTSKEHLFDQDPNYRESIEQEKDTVSVRGPRYVFGQYLSKERENALTAIRDDPKASPREKAAALEEVVSANHAFVYHIADKLCSKADSRYDDIIQEGHLGMVQAWKKFDSRKARFTSYAMYWIRANMLRYMMENHGAVKIGKSIIQRRLFYKMIAIWRGDIEGLSEVSTNKEIADKLGEKEKHVQSIRQVMIKPTSLDTEFAEGGTLHHITPSHKPQPDILVERPQEDSMWVNQVMEAHKDTLSQREKDIWKMRWQPEGRQARLEDIGNEWGVSRERVRQVEEILKYKFRSWTYEMFGDDFNPNEND